MESKLSPPTPPQKRRAFLGWLVAGFGTAAGVGVVGWKQWSKPGAGTTALPAGLPPLPSRDSFAGQLNSVFALTPDAKEHPGAATPVKPVEIKLIEVTESKLQPAGTRQMQTFSLLFEGPKSSALSQQTCTFRHASLGTFELFLVPVGKPKGDVVRYQAVFTIFA